MDLRQAQILGILCLLNYGLSLEDLGSSPESLYLNPETSISQTKQKPQISALKPQKPLNP